MSPRPRDRFFPTLLGAALWMSSLAMASTGCHSNSAAPASTGPTKIKVAYLGLTCEAAMFVAYEKGFFQEEGLDVEFVKTDWDGLRDGLGLGRFDANYTLIMYLLKPIEQGLDVKITGGVHSGCLRVQACAKNSIKTVEDLRGKRIGIPTMGSPPFLFTSRVLAAHGMDPKKDVEWVVIPTEVAGLAIDSEKIDAVANSEPIGSILLAQGKVRTIADQAVDPFYRDEYCCAVVVSGALAKRDPRSAAKVTHALLKGARWVDENPTAAAQLSVEKNYIAASVEINALALSTLKFTPGIFRCRKSLDLAATEMKAAGLLNPSTEPTELAHRAWLDLEGVSDDWIQSLKVEHVANGGPAPPLNPTTITALLNGKAPISCCAGR